MSFGSGMASLVQLQGLPNEALNGLRAEVVERKGGKALIRISSGAGDLSDRLVKVSTR